jgi:DHA1 family multidrug resistance protein-like MFS transporter
MTSNQTTDPRLASLRYAIFLTALPFGILQFALPLIGRNLGASAVQIGGLFAMFSLVLVVIRPLVGRGLDRYGRRPFLLAGLLGYALANGLYAFPASILNLYLARLAQGLGSGLMWLSAYAIVSDLAPAGRRGVGYGRVEEMASRGGIAGALVAFTVVGILGRGKLDVSNQNGWSVLFLAYTVATLTGVVVAWRGVSETSAPGHPMAEKTEARRPALPRQFRVLMGIVVLTAAGASLLWPILIVYLRDHVSPDILPLALAYVPAAIAAAVLPSRFGHLSDRFGRRPAIALGLLVSACVSLAIPATRSLVPLAFLWLAEAAAFAAAVPAEEALVADISGGQGRGTAFGFYTAAAGLGAVLGPLIGGFIYDHFAPEWAFRANALLLASGAVLYLLLIREPSRVRAPAEER